jgi:hypothetical protein
MKRPVLAAMIALMFMIGFTILLSSFMKLDTTSTNSDSEYGKICLDGVVYWRGYQLLAVKYKPDGNVELCK